MEARLAPLAALLDLNPDLVLNCLDDLSEVDGAARVQGSGNSIAFLTAHIADGRYLLAELLRAPLPNPLATRLAGAESLDELGELPSLKELRGVWTVLGTHLQGLCPQVSAVLLEAPVPQRFPGSDGTTLGAVAFLVQHESSHLGQIAMIRRLLGHPAMSYRRRQTAAARAVNISADGEQVLSPDG